MFKITASEKKKVLARRKKSKMRAGPYSNKKVYKIVKGIDVHDTLMDIEDMIADIDDGILEVDPKVRKLIIAIYDSNDRTAILLSKLEKMVK